MDQHLVELTKRVSRSVQTTIGWIFWDPGAVARYEAMGVPGPLGYLGSRSAPLAPAGPAAVAAAFGSITPVGIEMGFAVIERSETASFDRLWAARDEAVVEGLQAHAPDIVEPLRRLGPVLWPIVERLPTVGRVFLIS